MNIKNFFHDQNRRLTVEPFRITDRKISPRFDGFTILHLSDVHLPQYPEYIDNILRKAVEIKPDLIAISGDIVSRTADISSCGLSELAKGLIGIAQVFAVKGNHENTCLNVELWENILDDSGIIILEDRFEYVEIDNQKITVGGMNADNGYSHEKIFGGSDPDVFKLLIAHRPELFDEYSAINPLAPELVLSGHAHGGQWRFPIFGAVIAPDQGLFPHLTAGIHSANHTKIIISRGVGNSFFPLRLNNFPNMPLITLKSTVT